jgi:hypothetical protein
LSPAQADNTDAEYTFSTSYYEKDLYDTGTFNLLMSFRADPQTGEYGLPGGGGGEGAKES